MASNEPFDLVLAAAQAGAEWAFGVLYDEYNPRLLRYFAARAPRMAEDLAADTWLGAATGLPSFEGDVQRFRSWLFTIAHRRLVDHWRDQSATVAESGFAETSAEMDESPEETVIGAVSAQGAARKIASVLSPEQAEVVLLRVVGGLEVDQVAEILGKRPGTIRVLQHRALRKLVEEISLEDVTG